MLKLPTWIYKNLDEYGNCYLSGSYDYNQLLNHFTYKYGKVNIKIVEFETNTLHNNRIVKISDGKGYIVSL